MQISREPKRSARLRDRYIRKAFGPWETVIPSPREVCNSPSGYRDRYGAFECGISRYGAGGKERKDCPPLRPAPFQSPCVFARQARSLCELKVLKVPSRRIANCFVAPSQRLTAPRNWKYRGAALSNRLPRDRTIGFTLVCIYIRTYAIYRNAGFASGR